MSEPLIVKTLFTDISDLAQGFVERVGEDQLILAAASKVVEGEWTQFIVLLGDGTPAFAGVGRCVETADRGESASPESRYDLLLDSLRFEEDSQAVFDHLVLVRNDLLGDQESQEEADESEGSEAFPIDLNTAELKDFSLDEALDGDLPAPTQATPPEFVPDQPTSTEPVAEEEQPDEVEEAEPQPEAAEPEQQETVDGFVQQQIPGSILTRPVIARAWQPQAESRPEPRPSSDLFRYNGDGLPYPENPPRPDLDPSLWVAKAAHPNDPPDARRPIEAFAAASASAGSVETDDRDVAREVAARVAIDSGAEQGEGEQQPEQAEEEAFPEELGTAELIEGELEEIEDE
jgi:hypothetical protein